MKPADKHYKFINSKTGYVIYYHSIGSDHTAEQIRTELQEIKTRVAIKNGIYLETVYWEEFKDDVNV
ncbi:hypothetical protein [Mucilaginibacter lappiensis]|uniref:Uncharacterized protein n=1 Tax=Mucilaginibacter lappiensis TaxID=354630 RepID=A0A841JTN6_9SPHI|nr:hypothetical protein [Mucilaginibacter lappiensis]MBB6131191.1 hypothetical protein [Mucilaginibacter lappiensis]